MGFGRYLKGVVYACDPVLRATHIGRVSTREPRRAVAVRTEIQRSRPILS